MRNHNTPYTFNEEPVSQTQPCTSCKAEPVFEQPEQSSSAKHHGLTSAEYQQVIYDWNNTACDYPAHQTLHLLFEEQAQKTPDHIALVYENKTLTYRELDHASNQLAWFIRKQHQNHAGKLKPDTLITLFLERSLDIVIAILGVLKAGAAYVPVDPEYPRERIHYILNDTQSAMILTQRHLIASLQSLNPPMMIALDEMPYAHEKQDTLSSINHPDDLAYVMYTSGTTGMPKGVAITHAGIVNRIDWMQRAYPLNEHDAVLQKTPYGFDVSVWELLWAHQFGAKLVIAKPRGHQDALYLNQLIREQHVTVMHFVPSMLSAFTQTLHENHLHVPPSLRYVFCSGEALAASQVHDFYTLSHETLEIHNLYGPTEASIDVTFYPCSRHTEKVFIGKPIQNMHTYVLDEHLHPVAPGAVGELYLGGVGLARGYLNQPELTAERFVPNPFATQNFTRLYKTGDLARWTSEGQLEYLGRNDFQVKIRGYRIELNEIEHALSRHPHVRQSIVLAQDNQGDHAHRYLVAYYMSEHPITNADLMTHLQQSLPDYMLPSAFMHMLAFPLTTNGKLDRSALPKHTFKVNEQTYIAPQTTLEKTLANIWSNALGLETVGVDDHFFHLGGHSLSAARIVATIKQQLGKYISLADFYRSGTIANLIQCLDGAEAEDELANHHAMSLPHASDKLPLDDFQLMLWLSHLFEPKAKKMNIIVRKRMQGHLDVQAMHQAFTETFTQQAALYYRISRLSPTQYQQEKQLFHIAEQTINHVSQHECEAYLLQSVDELTHVYPWPRRSPLVLARLFHLPNNMTELQLCMPHLIADEMSLQILCADLSRNYLNIVHHQNKTVPVRAFKDYIHYEQETNNKALDEKLTFWENYLHDARLFNFPQKHIVDNMEKKGFSYSTYTKIPESTMRSLKQFCTENHVNVSDALCATLATALQRCCDEHEHESNPVLINLIKSTRENPEYDNTIGCFVRVDPLKIDLRGQPNMSSLSRQIHRTTLDLASFQQCSTLLKFTCLTKCFQKKALAKAWLTRLGMSVYSKLLKLFNLNFKHDKVLSLCWRLAAFNRKHFFVVNLNLWNNFLGSHNASTDKLFGLQPEIIPMHPYELLTIDYTLDVCFLRDDVSQIPYLVISSNLTPAFRESLAKTMLELIAVKQTSQHRTTQNALEMA